MFCASVGSDLSPAIDIISLGSHWEKYVQWGCFHHNPTQHSRVYPAFCHNSQQSSGTANWPGANPAHCSYLCLGGNSFIYLPEIMDLAVPFFFFLAVRFCLPWNPHYCLLEQSCSSPFSFAQHTTSHPIASAVATLWSTGRCPNKEPHTIGGLGFTPICTSAVLWYKTQMLLFLWWGMVNIKCVWKDHHGNPHLLKYSGTSDCTLCLCFSVLLAS